MTLTPAKPRPLALSLGDPAGVGPETIVKAWNALRRTGPSFMVVGDYAALAAASPGVGAAGVRRVGAPDEAPQVFADALPVLDLPLLNPVVAGKPSPAHAPNILRWIETGAGLSLSGAVCGLVTAPIAKKPLYEAGFNFPGHTEFLAELTAGAQYDGPRGPVMMLAARDLRTVLVTIHQPLRHAIDSLSIERIVGVGRVADAALRRDFGIASPRLALAALNPHAGESGALGREEIDVLNPAAARLRALGVACADAHPADSLFHEEARARYDAVICLYHDQALIPVKTLDFWGGVNVTLGLPIVRTSPDHGVGYDIAGRGLARPDSLIAAIRAAADIAGCRNAVGFARHGLNGVSVADLPPLREGLAAHGLYADKGFGQHFLLDLNLTRRIARLAGPLDGCAVLEVGPGPGGLTRALLEEGAAHVVALEKDARFLPLLDELAEAASRRLSVVREDALKADPAALLAAAAPGLPVRVVANLPYNVATPLLIGWLTGPFRPASMTLMFQKEVADRIAAPAGSNAYGRLSVLAQALARAEVVLKLGARAFTPPPKVDSAVVRLERRADAPDDVLTARLEQVTAAAFGQRRKMLRSSLRALGGEGLLNAAGVDPNARAETVPVEGFLHLAAALAPPLPLEGRVGAGVPIHDAGR